MLGNQPPENAYKHAQETLPPQGQLFLLYETAIVDLMKAKEAIEARNHEERFQHIEQVGTIINSLRAGLDHDAGAELAETLDRFYGCTNHMLLKIQYTNDIELCNTIMSNLKLIQSLWQNASAEDDAMFIETLNNLSDESGCDISA